MDKGARGQIKAILEALHLSWSDWGIRRETVNAVSSGILTSHPPCPALSFYRA